MSSKKPPPDGQTPPPEAPWGDSAAVDAAMRDWTTVWQSEIAAMGVDRELQECWARMAREWAEAGARGDLPGMLARMMPSRDPVAGEPAGSTRTDAAARPSPLADAPDAGADVAALRRELVELRDRVERLEAARPRRRRPAGRT